MKKTRTNLVSDVLTKMRGRFEELAGATGLEPAASCVTGRPSLDEAILRM